ncbi:MAG: hypothetical protein ACJAU6_003502 [Alphaproteobacteria bacterium]|jgi:hypothetical protein
MNKRIFGFCILIASIGLSACTTTIKISEHEYTHPSTAQVIPGKFIASIQTGGWDLTASTGTFRGSLLDYDVDLDEAFKANIKKAISQTVQSVTFTD